MHFIVVWQEHIVYANNVNKPMRECVCVGGGGEEID